MISVFGTNKGDRENTGNSIEAFITAKSDESRSDEYSASLDWVYDQDQ